jgi:hypothetical protein
MSWALDIEIVSAYMVDFDFSLTWDWCHWKLYVILFLFICIMSKSEFVCILVVNLKARWSWTPSWIRVQILKF